MEALTPPAAINETNPIKEGHKTPLKILPTELNREEFYTPKGESNKESVFKPTKKITRSPPEKSANPVETCNTFDAVVETTKKI